jgi:hypothetical protein
MVTSGGLEARKNCPVPAPQGSRPPQDGVCDAGYGIYWSYELGDWIAYNGHDGTDYGISYRPLYATADSDRVMYAGWWDPQNHTAALGIYVKLHHANGYVSSYGHMSSIAVQACLTNGCSDIPHGEMLGISGNTGNSTGPHLHFQLTSPAGVQVDPYGWTGSGNDPWPYNQPESLWVMYPLLISYGPRALPSGSVALDYPSPPATGMLVDDSSARFSQEPAECWNDISVSPGQAQNANMSYVKPRVGAPNCIGRWAFPQGSTAGQYAVYVRIPAVRNIRRRGLCHQPCGADLACRHQSDGLSKRLLYHRWVGVCGKVRIRRSLTGIRGARQWYPRQFGGRCEPGIGRRCSQIRLSWIERADSNPHNADCDQHAASVGHSDNHKHAACLQHSNGDANSDGIPDADRVPDTNRVAHRHVIANADHNANAVANTHPEPYTDRNAHPPTDRNAAVHEAERVLCEHVAAEYRDATV